MKFLVSFVLFLAVTWTSHAQLLSGRKTFTRADSLRGSNNQYRNWWDVYHYDLEVSPDYATKSIKGRTRIIFAITGEVDDSMQIDLQQPLEVDSVQATLGIDRQRLNYTRDNNIVWIQLSAKLRNELKAQGIAGIEVHYHGKPLEAVNPPWDGGWIWKTDKRGRPWMSVAVQGLGASAWYPCKDYQADEPDKGALIAVNIDTSLTVVANGILAEKKLRQDASNLVYYKWLVKSPINNYNLVPYIGHYVHWEDTLQGENGLLGLDYWVLDYNLDKAQQQFQQVKPTLRSMEYWFGPYPFYKDGYKLVEAPHLGMEHQSAVAYGNAFKNGYLGKDLSGTGEGMKFDFIIVHETGHEWFGNNITTKDIADMWVHESFTSYSETLYLDYYYGSASADEYCKGVRQNVQNKQPMITNYGVNEDPDIDVYYKGENMLHTFRKSLGNDEQFRQILRGLNKQFYHATVTSKQVVDYILEHSSNRYAAFFRQYLETAMIPELQFFMDKKGHLNYRWGNVVEGFWLPLRLEHGARELVLEPSTTWTCKKIKIPIKKEQVANLEKLYYIKVKQTKGKQ